MAAKVQTEVVGADRLARTLTKAGQGLEDMTEAGTQAARAVVERARSLAPFRSGRLRASIRGEAQPTGADLLAGYASVRYAGVQEYGWAARHIHAQPYMRPALAQSERQVEAAYQAQADHLLGQVRGA